MGLTHSFAADEAAAAPQRSFSAGLLPEDQAAPLQKKPKLETLRCGADDDLVQKYDELLETFDAEQARFSERLRGLERQHEMTMTALAAERDSLQAQLQAKQATFDERLADLEAKLTALLRIRLEEKHTRMCKEYDDELARLLAEIAALEEAIASLRGQYEALVARMADNEKRHEQDVIRAIDETRQQQHVSSQEQLATLQKTIDDALDALRRRRDELKKLLSEDEASYARELDELRASHMNALRSLEMELRASFEAAQKASEGDHARVASAKKKLSDEAERMRLERDAADARLKELEERARLAKLHLEETRDRHANEDATLMKQLDAREKAFRESCIDDPEEELAHKRSVTAKAKAAHDAEADIQRSRLEELRSKLEAIKRQKQSEVDALKEQVKRAEAIRVKNEADAEEAVQKRANAYRHELQTATAMARQHAAEREEQKAMQSVVDTAGGEAFSITGSGDLDGRLATLRSDACALKAAVAELERTLKAESDAHDARSKALQNALRRADAQLVKLRTGKTSSAVGLGTFDDATQDEWHAVVNEGRSLINAWEHDGDVKSISETDALGRRSNTVAQAMGVVSQELGRATGDRHSKLKARHDDLSKEASILERLQKNTVTSASQPALTNTRLEALKIAKAVEVRTTGAMEAMKSVQVDVTDSLEAINQQLQGEIFVDLTYPPTEVPGIRTKTDQKPGGRLVYKRSSDIFSDPRVFKDDIHPDDVRQGRLGDCWLMCALSACAEFPALIKKLFPDGTKHANGLYRVKLCLGGTWRTIVVDDFFPCDAHGGPVYSRAKHEELWVLLLEKAHAKASGNFTRLRGGLAAEGLMDLTGLPTFRFKFTHVDHVKEVESGALFDRLVYADTNRCVAVASTPGEDRFSEHGLAPATTSDGGLVPGHAYALIAARRIDGHRLIWLRNPWWRSSVLCFESRRWRRPPRHRRDVPPFVVTPTPSPRRSVTRRSRRGKFEWTGAWSDADARWTPEFRQQVASELGVDAAEIIKDGDGAFWMAYDDFVKYFAKFSVSLQRSPSQKAWAEARCRGAVTVAEPALCYSLKLTRPAHVVVGVHQRDERTLGAPGDYAHVGFAVLRDGKYITGCSPASDRQQFSPDIKSLEVWPAGDYVVCAYCLQHSLRKPKSNYFTDSWPAKYDPVAFRTTTDEIFSRFNVSGSGSLSVGEGGEAASLLAACGLTKIADITQLMAHAQKRDGLSPNDLGNWLSAHKNYAEVLKTLGYEHTSKGLICVGARGLGVSVHADAAVSLKPVASTPSIVKAAEELPILRTGTMVPYDDLEVYALRRLSGASVLVKNVGSQKTKVTVDVAKSRNCQSHTGALVASASLNPGEARVLHHVCPAGRGAWGFAYELSWKVLG
jgi:hypothetical protein